MNVLVYNGEKFQRSKVRYLIFTLVVASVCVFSLLNGNVVGAVLIFFLLGAYFYYSTISDQIITISLRDAVILIGTKTYPLSYFTGYVLELDPVSQDIKHIVFVTAKGHMIYTFDDSSDTIVEFLRVLDTSLPMMESYPQTSFEKFSRKMKL